MSALRPFGGPKYDENKTRCRDGSTACGYCGRAVKDSWKDAVRVVDGGARFATRDEPAEEAGDMGCFPIGPDCARKLRAAGLPVFPWRMS